MKKKASPSAAKTVRKTRVGVSSLKKKPVGAKKAIPKKKSATALKKSKPATTARKAETKKVNKTATAAHHDKKDNKADAELAMLLREEVERSKAKKAKAEADKIAREQKIAEIKRKEEEEKARALEELKKKQAKDEKGVRHCELPDVLKFIEVILNEDNKVPLIIDHERQYSRFNEYRNVVQLQMKKYVVKVYVQKSMTKEEAREEMRQKVVTAMKYGTLLQIDMADTAADLMKDFCGPDTFPTDLILTPGALNEEKHYSVLLREEDKDEYGHFLHKGFQAIVSTDFEGEEFAEFLADALPIDKLAPLEIIEKYSA